VNDGLEIADVAIAFGAARVVDGVSLSVPRGSVLGLVGESGSGKSMIALACLGLVPRPGVVSGAIRIVGRNIVGLPERDLRAMRGGDIGIVFQDPMTSLNPVRRIGVLMAETIRRHQGVSDRAAMGIAEAALAEVGIPSPAARLRAYAHELSGGLRQRVMIAMALVNRPGIILADEPTTALDATIQAQILDLLRARVADAAAVLITHDLGVAATLCDRIAVIYSGRIVEAGPMAEILTAPRHPYTAGLLRAVPRFDPARPRLVSIPGLPPRPEARPPGCAFAPRCPRAAERCQVERPALRDGLACWNPER
jgi:peptide/nickel transport system ATP-binding protein